MTSPTGPFGAAARAKSAGRRIRALKDGGTEISFKPPENNSGVRRSTLTTKPSGTTL